MCQVSFAIITKKSKFILFCAVVDIANMSANSFHVRKMLVNCLRKVEDRRNQIFTHFMLCYCCCCCCSSYNKRKYLCMLYRIFVFVYKDTLCAYYTFLYLHDKIAVVSIRGIRPSTLYTVNHFLLLSIE